MIVVGIDPGSNVTGYAFLRWHQQRIRVLEYGVVRLKPKTPLPDRLGEIYSKISRLLQQYQPDALSLEKAFVAEYPNAALILGHVRGCLMTAAFNEKVPVFEYEARVVKKSVVGLGSASKSQVSKMVQKVLMLKEAPKPSDAADALAVAYCHLLRQGAR